jgi:hypothetical protein
MKQLRRLLEHDLTLVALELDGPPHKEYISSKVEEVVKLLLQRQLEDALAAQGASQKPKLGASERGQQLKALLKAATVTCVALAGDGVLVLGSLTRIAPARDSVPPQAYTKAAGDEAVFCGLLEELLAKDGLNASSTPADCDAVKKKKLLARELEGIDTANIVEGRQRRGGEEAFTHYPGAPAAAPAAPPRLPSHHHHKPALPAGLAKKQKTSQGVKDWDDDE